MIRKPRSDARTRILDAALAVADRVGAANLTLDAVAADAGVSKGGLLYHFASKDQLLRAVVEHHMAEHQRDLDLATAQFPATPGGYLQAFVHAQRGELAAKREQPGTTRSFIAAAVNTPDLLEQPRARAHAHTERLRQLGPDFIEGLLVTLALDGLFFRDTFEMLDLDDGERDRLMQALGERAAAVAARTGSPE
ncbi:TetR/AcrR family transcriptional regulator [Luteimonas sp BLCC-B24]|uniref:TetR/AcrR family transcriptional regulator n=1 Tax=Luteimonas sp. BLCC-B24 TaxID=3025317 RepID=UPI00234C3AFB|nr:TetR/AcrR family transcriptional regulator [Luteimonas sp. BLCC-B24]MDC7808078.1 TetR/AcrR family transcriptional regulator [Luteimonas sp. BLCC-B24]